MPTFFANSTYKAWYYGLYINTEHNIIIDSCKIADSNVGIFTLVLGPPCKIFLANTLSNITLIDVLF
jgi:hypothetical protein